MSYTVKIEECGNVIESLAFETIKEAKKAIRQMMKKYSMIRHAGHIVNYSEYTELWTNF